MDVLFMMNDVTGSNRWKVFRSLATRLLPFLLSLLMMIAPRVIDSYWPQLKTSLDWHDTSRVAFMGGFLVVQFAAVEIMRYVMQRAPVYVREVETVVKTFEAGAAERKTTALAALAGQRSRRSTNATIL